MPPPAKKQQQTNKLKHKHSKLIVSTWQLQSSESWWEAAELGFSPLGFWRVLPRSSTHRMRIKNKQQQQQRSLQMIFSNNLKSQTLVQTCPLFSETSHLRGIWHRTVRVFRKRLFTCVKQEGDGMGGGGSRRIAGKLPELSSGDSSGSHPKAGCLSYQSLDKAN